MEQPTQETAAEGRLEVLAGPLQGATLPLAGETSIGREPDNSVVVLDSAVSRHHCVIHRKPAGFILTDLDSRNRTLVNGLAVGERQLQPGDKIKVGRSVFLFTPGDARKTDSVDLVQGELRRGSTVILHTADSIYLSRTGAAEKLAPAPRTLGNLNALLRISRALNMVRGLEEMQKEILDSLRSVIPAGRAALLLTPDGSGGFESKTGWDRETGFGGTVQVSQTIVNKVIEEDVSFLNSSIADAPESIITSKVHSVLAVPLRVFDRITGVLYLDASDPAARFDEDHLQVVTAVGGIAAVAIENCRRFEQLESENRRLESEAAIEHDMIGGSAAMQKVFQFISRVAPQDCTVLIWGESGTGKELVARATHRNSPRRGKPFIAINCAALTDTLLESEMFGHEKGAFTGAEARRKGKLEAAEGGTIFLDEIAELAPQLQAKLLRVLQEREFERVGGTETIKLDVRIIAATNRDLKERTAEGAFRADLYYRLDVVSIKMPGLRERREDIPALAAYFASKFGEKVKRPVLGLSSKARACLTRYSWPGNVRELQNAIERAVVLGSTGEILADDLPDAIVEEAAPPGDALCDGVRAAKKTMILEAIEKTGGRHAEAAELLGVHPNHLSRLIRTLNLKPKRAGRQ